MLMLERSAWWFDLGSGYLEFAGFVGWIMCAALAAMVPPLREMSHTTSHRIAGWTAQIVPFALFAGSALVAVVEQNGRGWTGMFDARTVATAGVSLGVLLLLTRVPLGVGRWRRTVMILVATVPLAGVLLHSDTASWLGAAVYGGGGVWLLFRPGDASAKTKAASPSPKESHAVGIALVTHGLAAAAASVAPQTAASAVVAVVGAFGTGTAWWCIYLQGRTLPRVRERHGSGGVRLEALLPAVLLGILVLGGLAQNAAVRQTKDAAARRLVEELRAITAALGSTFPGSHPNEDAELRAGLQALLATTPAIRACAWVPTGAATSHHLALAVKSSAAGDSSPTDLWPRQGREQQATTAGEPVVRWNSWARPQEPVIVFLPRAESAVHAQAGHLAVAMHAQGLVDVVVSHRLQMFAIIALLSLLAGSAVLATVRARNETELRLLRERAGLENEARNDLLAMVSHEVRTPLQSVLGYAELAAMDALPPAAERYVRAIRGQGAALLRIVQDILDLSAHHSGRLALQPEPVELTALATEVRQALGERARRKGLTLTITVAESAPAAVLVDRVRLVQVLLNLIGNAIKFTIQGGVRVTISPLAHATDPTQARLEFRVEDTGPGISEAQLRRVFEPFRKLREDGGGNSGVGLGLAICKQIVTTLRGEIAVESREGQGTTFRVELTLPTVSPSVSAAVQANSDHILESGAGTLAGLRVLLVEDHPFVRDLLRDSLQRLGAYVSACADGATGLATATQSRHDVVLLDLRLPDRSPEQMLAGLRPSSARPHEPWIVGLSAGATEAEIQQVLERGMNDFLLKPVSIAGLAETLRLSPAGAKLDESAVVTTTPARNPRAATGDERTALLAEAAPAIVRIAHACHIGDSDRAAAEAHFLANSCVMLGLHAAQSVCRTIEEAAEIDDLAGARAALRALRAEIARAHAEESPGVR